MVYPPGIANLRVRESRLSGLDSNSAVLWFLSSDTSGPGRRQGIGYSLVQINQGPMYSGPPEYVFTLPSGDIGIGHGIVVLPDATMLIAVSEAFGDTNYDESFLVVPAGVSGQLSPGDITRVRSGDIFGVTDGARTVQPLADGSFVLAGPTRMAVVTMEQLLANDFVNNPVTVWQSSTTLMWSCVPVPGEPRQFWIRTSNGFRLFDLDTQPGGGLIAPTKIAQGSNFGPYGEHIAMDAVGGLWGCRDLLGVQDLTYYDPAALAALTGTASNPAPTRTLTSDAFDTYDEELSWFELKLDASGGAWVTASKWDYVGVSRAVYFTAGQLAAGGEQVPAKTIDNIPMGAPLYMAFAPGYGLYPG